MKTPFTNLFNNLKKRIQRSVSKKDLTLPPMNKPEDQKERDRKVEIREHKTNPHKPYFPDQHLAKMRRKRRIRNRIQAESRRTNLKN